MSSPLRAVLILTVATALATVTGARLIAQSTRVAIETRDRDTQGILVGPPRMYDDSLLQQMLTAAEARLVSLQLLDQTGIANRLGSITGANQQISGVAISASGNPIPQVVTTANGATSQVAATQTPSGTSTVTTTGAPVQTIVSTAPQVSAPAASSPAPSTSLPSSFSVSASDVLNEQMQLTYEIANLRLLMEGSLSDWQMDGKLNANKPRVTIGFPITISPDKRFKNAAAIVEVTVATDPRADLSTDHAPPSVTALLPREKTYNVASITDRSVSLGGGLVTQIAGISGSFLWGHKTYFVVKDQDTVARMFQPGDPKQAGFLWEFHPVLGRSFVESGLKQTFVQLAFTTPGAAGVIGSIHVRTYWRNYDRKSGLLKGVIEDSIREYDVSPVSTFAMTPDLAGVGADSLEDLGNGQMLVTIPGRFLGGTYVRVGSAILGPGTAGFTSEYRLIRFVAPIADLASKRVVLVSRDGTETEITVHGDPVKKIDFDAAVTPLDETNSVLEIDLKQDEIATRPSVLIVGGKVFGYSDAPIYREGRKLSVVLPTSFLISNPQVIVKPLLAAADIGKPVALFPAGTENARLVLISQTSSKATFILFGRRLTGITVVSPADVQPKPVGNGTDSDTMVLLDLDLAVAKSQKQIVMQRRGERAFEVPIPSLASADQPKRDPKFQERVVVGADEATIVGDGLDTIEKVLFGKKELTISDKSAKAIKLKGLAAAGVTAIARTQDISLVSATGTTRITLEVVNQKIETVAK